MNTLTKNEKISRIDRAIVIVQKKVASIPSTLDTDALAVRAAEKRIKTELRKDLGAKFWFGADGKYHLQMAHVSASCVDDGSKLFRSWQLAAGRMIVMLRVVAA